MSPNTSAEQGIALPEAQAWLDQRLLGSLRSIAPSLQNQDRIQVSNLDHLDAASSLEDLARRSELPLSTLRRMGLTTMHAQGALGPNPNPHLAKLPPSAEGAEVLRTVENLQIPGWDTARTTLLGMPLVLSSVVPSILRFANSSNAFQMSYLELMRWSGPSCRDRQIQRFAQSFVRSCIQPDHSPVMLEFLQAAARYCAVANSMELLLSQVSLPERQRCSMEHPYVDVACGFNIGAFAGSWPRVARLIGIDPHPFVKAYVDCLCELLEAPPIEIIPRTLRDCTFQDGTIGVLRLKHTEKYVPELGSKLTEMMYWIAPQGALIIQTESNRQDRMSCLDFYLDFLHDLIDAGWRVRIQYRPSPRFASELDTIIAERDLTATLPGMAQTGHARLNHETQLMLADPGFEYESPLARAFKSPM